MKKLIAEAILIFATLVATGCGTYILYDALFGEGRRQGMTFQGVLLSLLEFILAAGCLGLFMNTIR